VLFNYLKVDEKRQTSHWVVVEADFQSQKLYEISRGEATKFLVPGLVDIHCHGYAGFDVMKGHGDEVVASLRKLGIEWIYPTTITADWDEIRLAIHSINPKQNGFAGVHLEGPFINPSMAGAQPSTGIRDPSFEELQSQLGNTLEKLKIVTLAPERFGGIETTKKLTSIGITVSAGHTDADYFLMTEAHNAGLRHMTHFFNAMKSFHHRTPGCVEFGLVKPLYCELIYDRIHVSREAAQLLWNCKGPFSIIGVSDGTALSGTPDGTTDQMWGHEVKRTGNRVELKDGTLAGSCATIRDVFSNIWTDFGKTEAVLSCSLNPRRSLGLPYPCLWLTVSQDGDILDHIEAEFNLVSKPS
jgi:N-acetylglucosamine-6-phosphate deacetylase